MNDSHDQRRWVREEVVVLVAEYFLNKNLSAKQVDESYYRISALLRKREEMITGKSVDDIFRDYAGIKMQTGRVRCLDPEAELSGMQGTKLQKEVVNEYLQNSKAIISEMELIYKKYGE